MSKLVTHVHEVVFKGVGGEYHTSDEENLLDSEGRRWPVLNYTAIMGLRPGTKLRITTHEVVDGVEVLERGDESAVPTKHADG